MKMKNMWAACKAWARSLFPSPEPEPEETFTLHEVKNLVKRVVRTMEREGSFDCYAPEPDPGDISACVDLGTMTGSLEGVDWEFNENKMLKAFGYLSEAVGEALTEEGCIRLLDDGIEENAREQVDEAIREHGGSVWETFSDIAHNRIRDTFAEMVWGTLDDMRSERAGSDLTA